MQAFVAMDTKFTGVKYIRNLIDWLSDYNIWNRLCLAMTFGNCTEHTYVIGNMLPSSNIQEYVHFFLLYDSIGL